MIRNDKERNKVYFVASVEDSGLHICGINITDFTNKSLAILYFSDYNCQILPGRASSYLAKPEYSFGLDEYADSTTEVNAEELFFYGISLQPPGIIEYSIVDINNV